MTPIYDSETQTLTKRAEHDDLNKMRQIMQRIYDEEPSYWPHGLSPEHCDGGAYLIEKAASREPVGFVGWQERNHGRRRVGYYAIGILPEFRGQKFAKRAVHKLVQAKAAGVDEVRAYIVPGNSPSIALANSLDIPVVHKCASAKLSDAELFAMAPMGAAMFKTASFLRNLLTRGTGANNALFTVGNAAAWDALGHGNQGMDHYLKDWDTNRVLNFGLNGAVGRVAAGQPDTLNTLSTMLLSPTKDLIVAGVKELPSFGAAARKYISSPAGNSQITVNTPDAPAPNINVNAEGKGIDPKFLWGGLGLAGILGLGGLLSANRSSNALRDIATRQDKGTIRVTLPTKQPGDEETSITMPLDQIPLSKTLEQRIRRDQQRRLMAETRNRAWRRTPDGRLVDPLANPAFA